MSRPRSAAAEARSRASFALLPKYSRVSRPVFGAYNSATAAPLIAPNTNASMMLPAPDPSSFDMVDSTNGRLKPAPTDALEDAHAQREVLPRVLDDLIEQRVQL